ncbi:unnamed protein product [Effrenium voratum]|uniref:Uncharacterized protein n=1 Tax=Effrenium voratum TaxID=2562239 RepID=A0AA36JN54_9DINO|nr:unnamed protein product [Effrenium voratum]CAJ1416782.1 unnamed protein product [Effrenium voratum]
MLQRMMKNRHRLQHFAAALAVSQLHRIVPEASVAKASTAAAAADLPRRVDQAKRLRDVYQTRFAFPEWSVELLERGELEQLSHKVTVYFPRGAHRGDVERLTKEREPVNIAMQRYYDKEKLQQFFGFTEGFYAKSSAEKLLPNIAIYCQTPMRSAGEQADVHVINVIGYAFDVPEQPDFQYFLSGRGKGTEEELVAKMRSKTCDEFTAKFAPDCHMRILGHGIMECFEVPETKVAWLGLGLYCLAEREVVGRTALYRVSVF